MKDTEGLWHHRFRAMATGLLRPGPATLAHATASGAGSTATATTWHPQTADDLRQRIGTAAFAFRGYDHDALGRSPELLAHPAYGPVVRSILAEGSALCSEALGTRVDLAARIEAQTPSSLGTFAEDVATIVGMELAQVRLLEEFFGVEARGARLSFGYSIGELAAVVLGGVFTLEQLLPIPLALARDCADLAADVSLGVLFTRSPSLPQEAVQRLCLAVSSEGRGLVGPSAFLAPNTALVLGQGDTLDRLERLIPEFLPGPSALRRKPHRWPPLHTPLVRLRNIPNRTAVALYQIEGGGAPPTPRVLSCTSGEASYDAQNVREVLTDWTDHPQRIWDVIDQTLASGVERVIHVGPQPTLVPATFARLSKKVEEHRAGRYFHRFGRGVVSSFQRHAWLAPLLPAKANLLRAPDIDHVVLEDWLLDHAP